MEFEADRALMDRVRIDAHVPDEGCCRLAGISGSNAATTKCS
ncbi:hypothetical protein [Streptomyces sp. NPDC059224]